MIFMPIDHGNLTEAMKRDPSVSGFVAKHSMATNQQPSGTVSVHVVYLVPSDKKPRHIYTVALRKAIREMRAFYQEELGITESRARASIGETFDISSPVVEIVVTPHDSAYYNANNQAGSFEFFSRAVEDGFEATGGAFNDPENIWVFYIDADPACGRLNLAVVAHCARRSMATEQILNYLPRSLNCDGGKVVTANGGVSRSVWREFDSGSEDTAAGERRRNKSS